MMRVGLALKAAPFLLGMVVLAMGCQATDQAEQPSTEAWTRQFGSTGLDHAQGVAADGVGSLYMVGFTDSALPGQTSAGGQDAYVRKYDSSGSELWTPQFGIAWFDQANSVAVDGAVNVYVAGMTDGALRPLFSRQLPGLKDSIPV